EMGISTEIRYGFCSQNGVGGRIDQWRNVGVPAWTIAAVLLAIMLAIALAVRIRRDRMNFRKSGGRAIAFIGMAWRDVAELAAERDMLGMVQMLVAKVH